MMDMPVPCKKCNEWVELNDCRNSDLTKRLLCPKCWEIEDAVNDLKVEIDNIEYMFDTNDETLKGDRRGWRKLQKQARIYIIELGYNYDDLI